jgi:hypothetical protein
MAGAGKKTFASGEVLTASDVNGYLMDQAVMKFADSSARGSAIASPSEGMVTYLDDTNAIEVYDGSAWTGVSNAYGISAVRTDVDVSLSPGSSTIKAVAWPSGRFSAAPVVTGIVQSDAVSTEYGFLVATLANASTAVANFVITNTAPGGGVGGTVTSYSLEVHAIQMTAGSATG